MAGCFEYPQAHLRVLDPGCGTGILSAAVCEAASVGGRVKALHIDAYDTDPMLAEACRLVLAFSRDWLARRDIALTFDVRHGDFLLDHLGPHGSTSGPSDRHHGRKGYKTTYDLVVSNPPYFKVSRDDPRAGAWATTVHGQPNIYALFMTASAELLSEPGMLVYIVPRSFASGQYFRRFRKVFFRRVTPVAVHLFESRKDVFKDQAVLQESVIIAARSLAGRDDQPPGHVHISHSKAVGDLSDRRELVVDTAFVLDPASENSELSIPHCYDDLELSQVVRAWPSTLGSLGLEISTGPVVPFRAEGLLTDSANGALRAPLIWMQHVRPMRTVWPSTAVHKPQWIQVTPESAKLLVEDANYVLMRRFSAKEEKRRLVAAPLVRGSLGSDTIGLENHLNYIRGESRELDEELVFGLSTLFNSVLLDRYFRMSNGNTQVSATELRAMPLPAEGDIRSIGSGARAAAAMGTVQDFSSLDALVARTLGLPARLLV